jgi:crotonobetainyl-CoA:carnitine CoA-transferase CaiB-like acyl-CoA transferase
VTNRERLAHRDELLPILQDEFLKWTAADLERALVEAEVPVAPINPIDVALGDTQVRHRDMVVKVRHRSGKEFLTLGTPVKPDDAVGEEFRSPPGLGADSASVLRGLGYSDEEISTLGADGIVRFDAER